MIIVNFVTKWHHICTGTSRWTYQSCEPRLYRSPLLVSMYLHCFIIFINISDTHLNLFAYFFCKYIFLVLWSESFSLCFSKYNIQQALWLVEHVVNLKIFFWLVEHDICSKCWEKFEFHPKMEKFIINSLFCNPHLKCFIQGTNWTQYEVDRAHWIMKWHSILHFNVESTCNVLWFDPS